MTKCLDWVEHTFFFPILSWKEVLHAMVCQLFLILFSLLSQYLSSNFSTKLWKYHNLKPQQQQSIIRLSYAIMKRNLLKSLHKCFMDILNLFQCNMKWVVDGHFNAKKDWYNHQDDPPLKSQNSHRPWWFELTPIYGISH